MSDPTRPQNFKAVYEAALAGIAKDPNDRRLQHQAVLALARLGATAFAESEYTRYGLDKVVDDEDIMALAARLEKDKALNAIGAERAVYAERSAALYDTAYIATGGYYSGINAATMSLVAGAGDARVAELAKRILRALPERSNAEAETLYYIEATRAEGHLLLSNTEAADVSLRAAVEHDPLNYAAHATTLRQFKMIADAREENYGFLNRFRPPKVTHFCGHLFASEGELKALDPAKISILQTQATDLIQQQDIAFAYGALAAGADLLIASALLDEGGELNVVLPVEIETFRRVSVAPYGAQMVSRFERCLEDAASIEVVSATRDWPNHELNAYAARIAMGRTIIRANELSTQACQVAVFDEHARRSNTMRHMKDWEATGRVIFSLPFQQEETPDIEADEWPYKLLHCLKRSDASTVDVFDTITGAVDAGLDAVWTHGAGTSLGLVTGPAYQVDALKASADAIVRQTPQGGFLMDEASASLLALMAADRFNIVFQGLAENADAAKARVYTATHDWRLS